MIRATLVTPRNAGAVAAVQLVGDAETLDRLLDQLCGKPIPRAATFRLRTIEGLDDLLIVRVTERIALLTPHGGMHIVARLLERVVAEGATIAAPDSLDPRELYPEARDAIEALVLDALARAASPLAIDLLLDQPRRWRLRPTITDDDRARSARLARLLVPSRVVLVGAANIGKSTLANALAGHARALTADEPGTTRDYVTIAIDLAGLIVGWFDTPGLRQTDDAIEREAQRIAERVILEADLLIAAADAEHDWPVLSRRPDLRVGLRCDIARRTDAPLHVSAVTGDGLTEFVSAVRDALVPPEDLVHPGPWLFDRRLLGALP